MHWGIVVKDKRTEWNWVSDILGCWEYKTTLEEALITVYSEHGGGGGGGGARGILLSLITKGSLQYSPAMSFLDRLYASFDIHNAT